MENSMRVEVNNDGSVTAVVGSVTKTFSDLGSAVAWATNLIYGGDDDGH